VRFHWYWPFARQEELDWARGTVRPGESIVVEVLDRPHAPRPGTHGNVTVVRDLPDVDRAVASWLWAPSRVNTYVRRAAARRSMWAGDDFDLVHLHYLNRFTDSLLPLPRPLVLSVHDVVPHRARLGRAENAVLRRTYHRGDALVVHHEDLRVRLVDQFDIDPAVVHVVPHQVFTAPDPTDPPADRAPMVLFFGALRANKGLDVLLEALRRIPGEDLRLVIAGRGDPEMEALARGAAGSDPRVTAEVGLVSLERKHELFQQASLVVLPYTSFASQSGVLHDAYGHGRPVVVTDVGALGASVREDGTGLVASVADPDDLGAKMLKALAEPARSRFSAAALAVRSTRSPERTGALLRSVYDDVLGAGHGRP
jgi:glycosyltransferase involved in cell wall biosynthesis